MVKLTAELVESFAGTFLSPRYDDPKPTPQFHREVWAAYCSAHPQVACAAPRDHAKSTGLTFDFTLAGVMFRVFDYVIIIGATEEKAMEQLSNISGELHDNEDLRREFRIKGFLADQKGEIIAEMQDGHTFRLLARGAEQKIRGALWKGKRPNLLMCDDIEDDEQVESKDRRRKFRHWFLRAARQALGMSGVIRVHGTILHQDSLLARLMRNETWHSLIYRAHSSFDDFSNILWPERWSEQALRRRRQEFIADNDAPGYSQEFLNDPFDHGEAYLRRDDFLPMEEEDFKADKLLCAAWDFAITQSASSDNTSCTVGGKDALNLLHVVDQRLGKWDSFRIIEEMFSVQLAWNPDLQWVEDDQVWKALSPMVYREMQLRDVWINLFPVRAVKDKAARGRSLQRRHRARGMRFDKQASWYAGYEFELLRFTETSQAIHDDQFDSTSLLSRGFDEYKHVEVGDFLTDDEEEFLRQDPRLLVGRNAVTGY